MRRQDVYERLDASATRMGFTVEDGEPLLYSASRVTALHFALHDAVEQSRHRVSDVWRATLEGSLGMFAMFRGDGGPTDWPVVRSQCRADFPPTRREYLP